MRSFLSLLAVAMDSAGVFTQRMFLKADFFFLFRNMRVFPSMSPANA